MSKDEIALAILQFMTLPKLQLHPFQVELELENEGIRITREITNIPMGKNTGIIHLHITLT